jgi:hypothetical protein
LGKLLVGELSAGELPLYQENNCPVDENSTNLVTLDLFQIAHNWLTESDSGYRKISTAVVKT